MGQARNKQRRATQKASPRKHAKHRRRALHMLRKSVEYQVRLAYAQIPLEAVALVAMRLRTRDELVNQGYLRVEELETLKRDDAVVLALKRIDRQLSAAERQRL